jgi:hypothetical protein
MAELFSHFVYKLVVTPCVIEDLDSGTLAEVSVTFCRRRLT